MRIKGIFKEIIILEVIYIKKEKKPTKRDLLKYEIAKELGLEDKIINYGWKSLTSRESGRIGGILNKKLKDLKQRDDNADL